MTHIIHKLFFSRHEKYFTFFFLIFKTIKIMTNNPMLFQYFLPSKLHKLCYFFNEKHYSSTKITYRSSKKTSSIFFLNLYYPFITYDGQKSNKQQAKSNQQRAKINKQRAKSNEQRAKLTSNEQKVTSNKPKLTKQRATSKNFSLQQA